MSLHFASPLPKGAEYLADIAEAAAVANKMSPYLLLGICYAESNFGSALKPPGPGDLSLGQLIELFRVEGAPRGRQWSAALRESAPIGYQGTTAQDTCTLVMLGLVIISDWWNQRREHEALEWDLTPCQPMEHDWILPANGRSGYCQRCGCAFPFQRDLRRFTTAIVEAKPDDGNRTWGRA